MRTLYPVLEARRSFFLPVGDGHTLYCEEGGNPSGQPVLFLHGGPGGGISAKHRQLFDPAAYRIILFDQRGAGQSTPHASLEHNTTLDLVRDIETLRQELGIEKWLVFGGSWGSTLALAYAQTHPERVSRLILRGIFMCRREELEWFYQSGAHWVFPERWEAFQKPIPLARRHEMIRAYYDILTGDDETKRLEAAIAWSSWEGAACKLIPDEQVIGRFEEAHHALAMARIECHYFMHDCWLEPNQLLKNSDRIRHIPTEIIHGRYDLICPVRNAWELAQELPQAKLTIVPDASHAYDEPGILDALLRATDAFRDNPPQ
jgi:proline iminopeptidase